MSRNKNRNRRPQNDRPIPKKAVAYSDDAQKSTGVKCTNDGASCLCYTHLNLRLKFYSVNHSSLKMGG